MPRFMRRLLGMLTLAAALCALAVPGARAAQAGAGISLALSHTLPGPGRGPYVPTGTRLAVAGTVTPYVAGQTVIVRFVRGRREVKIAQVRVAPGPGGTGRFLLGYTPPRAGTLTVTAEHRATVQLPELKSSAAKVVAFAPVAGFGDRGLAVRVLQDSLGRLDYAVPFGGVYDDSTGLAVLALRKVLGLDRTEDASEQVFHLLAEGAGAFRVHYRGDGRHVEADLTRQVLAEIDPHGRVHRIYPLSSGKPSTPTVIGRFRVYLKSPGYNSEGMYYSNYFVGGYAIHGYDPVPTYPASHGCLRVPITDALSIYGWVKMGTRVDVYYEGGGGSSDVHSNAGP
jgi:hypothetical protein